MATTTRAIAKKYHANQWIGRPIGAEQACADGVGRFQEYESGASIYYHRDIGTHLIYGLIRKKWIALGREQGPNGYPISDEATSVSGKGRFNDFQNGTIIWKEDTQEAFSVYGAIFNKWKSIGRDSSAVGFPIVDEQATPGNMGRHSEFERGAIYYNSSAGTHVVQSPVLEAWTLEGREQSGWKLPVSDTQSGSGNGNTYKQHFQGRGVVCEEVAKTSILVGSDLTCQIAPGSRSAVQTHRADSKHNRSYPLMSLSRHVHLPTALVIFRESYLRKLTNSEISDLQDSYLTASTKMREYTFQLAQISHTPVVIDSKLEKSDFMDVHKDTDPNTFHGKFDGYDKVKTALEKNGLDVDSLDIVNICIPWENTATDLYSDFAWANWGTEAFKFNEDKTWSTIHHICPPDPPYWWAFFLHENFHCIEWMLETNGYPELENPDYPFWKTSFPELFFSQMVPPPMNLKDEAERLGYAMYSRIKEHWFDLQPEWGKISVDASIDGSRRMLMYSTPFSNTLIETSVRVADLPS